MLGGRHELPCGRIFHEAPFVQHERALARRGEDAKVVTHQEQGHVALALLRAQELEHLRLNGDVQCRRRLVRDEQHGVEQECHRQQHALTLAPRQFMREPPGLALPVNEPNAVEHRDCVPHRPACVAFAVDGVSLDIARGETLALVGESGSGKTSLGRAILRLGPVAGGSVRFDGVDVLALSGVALRAFRRRAQVVFQDPKASLDPLMRVGDIVREGIDIHALAPRAEADRRVAGLLEEVGLAAADADRHPHEFSGGERQRIAIARALAVEP